MADRAASRLAGGRGVVVEHDGNALSN